MEAVRVQKWKCGNHEHEQCADTPQSFLIREDNHDVNRQTTLSAASVRQANHSFGPQVDRGLTATKPKRCNHYETHRAFPHSPWREPGVSLKSGGGKCLPACRAGGDHVLENFFVACAAGGF